MALRSKKAAAILLIVFVALFAAVYFSRDRVAHGLEKFANEATTPITVDDAASVGSNLETAKPVKQAIPSISSYLLPPVDKSINETFDELKQASDKGEKKATCRLAMELIRCQFSLSRDEKKLEAALSEPAPSEASRETQHYRDQAALADYQVFQACKKLSGKKSVDAVALLEQSANQHQLDAMVVWASGLWIEARHGESTAYLQDPAFDRWRASAVPMMNAAMQRGSLDAAAELWLGYKYDSGPLFRGLVRNDPKQAYIHLLLTGLILNKPRTAPSGMTTSDILDAQQTAQKMFQEWYGGIVTEEENITSARNSVMHAGDEPHDFCNSRLP